MGTKWICVQYENRTAYDTFDEERFEGPTNVPRNFESFATQDEAENFYESHRAPWASPYYWGFPKDLDEREVADLIAQITKYKDI